MLSGLRTSMFVSSMETGLSGCRLDRHAESFRHAGARDGAGKAFAWQPALDRRAQAHERLDIDAGMVAERFQEEDAVFRVDVAGRAGRERTAAEPAQRRVEAA